MNKILKNTTQPKNIEEYNPNRKRKTFIVFDDMIASLLNKKN